MKLGPITAAQAIGYLCSPTMRFAASLPNVCHAKVRTSGKGRARSVQNSRVSAKFLTPARSRAYGCRKIWPKLTRKTVVSA